MLKEVVSDVRNFFLGDELVHFGLLIEFFFVQFIELLVVNAYLSQEVFLQVVYLLELIPHLPVNH